MGAPHEGGLCASTVRRQEKKFRRVWAGLNSSAGPLVSRSRSASPVSRAGGSNAIVISKLPRWVWTGAWALAFVGGIVNVVGLLSFQHRPITHLTGTTSLLSVALADLDHTAILQLVA